MKNATVLVVDDQPEQQTLVSDYLVRQGYTVICVNNGKEAAIHNKKGNLDFVVTSTQMTAGDGIELLTAMQRMVFQPAVLLHHTATDYRQPNETRDYRLSAWVQAFIPFATFIIRPLSDLEFLQAISGWLTAAEEAQVA